jgi:nucleoside-diphosphate-sugar epimerase
MSNIGITGHTSGIGKALFDYFIAQGHSCIGFSRQNGYNIDSTVSREQIVDQCKDFDIFINNAYSNGTNNQLELLQEVYATWIGKDKLIINISSRVTDFVLTPSSAEHLYQTNKKAQDTFCLGKIKNPQIFNLKLGMVDTPRVSMYNHNKLAVEDVVKIISFVLDNRDAYKITTLTVGL